MSSYKPPEEQEEGDETADSRDIKSHRSLETIDKRSRREKALAILAIASAAGTVAYFAFGQVYPDSEFAEAVAQFLRDLGIDASEFLVSVDLTTGVTDAVAGHALLVTDALVAAL